LVADGHTPVDFFLPVTEVHRARTTSLNSMMF
jgi:hypothetical protein